VSGNPAYNGTIYTLKMEALIYSETYLTNYSSTQRHFSEACCSYVRQQGYESLKSHTSISMSGLNLV
jgi:hypothetical protein